MRYLGILLLLVGFTIDAQAAPPVITITSPTEGQTFDTATGVTTLSGSVVDPGDGVVQLFLNNIFVQNIPIGDSSGRGNFSTRLVLVSGANQIQISDSNADGTGTKTVNVTSTQTRNDIRVNMSWDDGATDIDLYVFAPADVQKHLNAEVIWFGHTRGTNQGRLDVDNVVGFGPENISFTAGTAPQGTYTGAVNFYARSGSERTIHARVTIFLNEGTLSQTVRVLDTITVTVPNFGSDVRNGESPKGTNSSSTIFFAFTLGSSSSPEIRVPVFSFPNPFNASAGGFVSIKSDSEKAITSVKIMTMNGRIVKTISGNSASIVSWDGRNSNGDLMGSGSYFIVVTFSDGKSSSNKMTLIH